MTASWLKPREDEEEENYGESSVQRDSTDDIESVLVQGDAKEWSKRLVVGDDIVCLADNGGKRS